jgi:bifunctional N-acetylglucosamine-1-phosphate-uridyltransferase/glucosamine-1-phosphate-acetyltransferase GlmU-like protein
MSLPPCQRVIVVAREDQIMGSRDRMSRLQSNCPGVEIVPVPGLTKGQAVTAMAGVKELPPDMPVLVASCDTGLAFDRDRFQALASDPSVDAVIFTFKGYLPAIWRPASYGWVDTDWTRAVKVAVKTRPRTSLRDACGIVGAFFFRSAGMYLEVARELVGAERTVNGEYYIDELMNIMLEEGKNVRVLDVDHYLVWGTPDEVRTYRYWQQHFHSNPRHPYNMSADPDFPDPAREGGL